jgi:hypothetical protein
MAAGPELERAIRGRLFHHLPCGKATQTLSNKESFVTNPELSESRNRLLFENRIALEIQIEGRS